MIRVAERREAVALGMHEDELADRLLYRANVNRFSVDEARYFTPSRLEASKSMLEPPLDKPRQGRLRPSRGLGQRSESQYRASARSIVRQAELLVVQPENNEMRVEHFYRQPASVRFNAAIAVARRALAIQREEDGPNDATASGQTTRDPNRRTS
jgi:hypothetical protein